MNIHVLVRGETKPQNDTPRVKSVESFQTPFILLMQLLISNLPTKMFDFLFYPRKGTHSELVWYVGKVKQQIRYFHA